MKGYAKSNLKEFPPPKKKVDSNTVRFLFQVALELFWELRFLEFFGPDFFKTGKKQPVTRNAVSLAGKIFSRRTILLLFFWLGGLSAGTLGNRTRPRRSRGAGQEKTECSLVKPFHGT